MPAPLRLLCALLTLLLVLPAVQANACAPGNGAAHEAGEHAAHQQATGHHQPGDHTPAKAPPAHDCIGCVAPIDMRVYRPLARQDFSARETGRAAHYAALSDHQGAPDTPPPRPTA